jgi:hypothetical protein
MTAAARDIEWKLRCGINTRLLTRRRLLSTVLSGLASAYALPSALDYFGGERTLLAEAAELFREVVTVDLHCHPNNLGGPHFPELDPNVPGNMKVGGLDAGLFAARGDYPLSAETHRAGAMSHANPNPANSSGGARINSIEFWQPLMRESSPSPNLLRTSSMRKRRACPVRSCRSKEVIPSKATSLV